MLRFSDKLRGDNVAGRRVDLAVCYSRCGKALSDRDLRSIRGVAAFFRHAVCVVVPAVLIHAHRRHTQLEISFDDNEYIDPSP